MRSSDTSGERAESIDWDAKLGLPNPFGATGWPTLYHRIQHVLLRRLGRRQQKAQHLTQYQIDDNVTWVKGKHTFKFGFKGRKEFNNVEELQQAQGSDSFTAPGPAVRSAAQGSAPLPGRASPAWSSDSPAIFRISTTGDISIFSRRKLEYTARIPGS